VTKPEPMPEGTPNATDIRSALERLIASPAFSKSPQLAHFIKFVVEETLAGRGDRIKAFTIAAGALGRDANFDPQNDPIVRVEAGRLRQALAQYYAASGCDDAVIIELPRGHYVPTFRRRADQPRFGVIAAAVRRLFHRASAVRVQLGILTIAMLLATFAGVGIVRWWQTSQTVVMTTKNTTADSKTSRFSGDPLPIVYVRPIDVIGTPVTSIITPEHLQTELCDALAHFDEIIVITDRECGDPARKRSTAYAEHPKGIDYIVSGYIDYGDGDSISTTLRLIARTDGMVVWTRKFSAMRLDAKPDLAQDAIVRLASVMIAQPNGVIQARERSRRAAGAAIDSRYDCLLDYNAYRQSFEPAAHERVKACLKQAISDDPTFTVGFLALARIYVRQFYTHFGFEIDEPRPLDQALRLAQRAIELNAESAEAQAVLMEVQFARRDFTAARAAGQNALRRNPNDMAVQAEYGFMLLRLGETEKAMPMMREAITFGYVPSPMVYYGLFAGAYLTGDLDEARRYADAIATDNFPVGLTAQALAAEKSGDRSRAARALNRLYELQPAWKTEPRRELEKVFEAISIVDRFADDLAAITRNAMN
jgi:tetratricopeptide (TPR) repeat protein